VRRKHTKFIVSSDECEFESDEAERVKKSTNFSKELKLNYKLYQDKILNVNF